MGAKGSVPSSSADTLEVTITCGYYSPFSDFSLLVDSPILSGDSVSVVSSYGSVHALYVGSALYVGASVPTVVFFSDSGLHFIHGSGGGMIGSPVDHSTVVSFSLSSLSALAFFTASSGYFFDALVSLLDIPVYSSV